MRQQHARRGEVGDVGVLLVREHRVAVEAAFLRALDLAVPVRALDQPHHEAQLARARNARHVVDHLDHARLVGLHREAEAAPARRVLLHVGGQRVEHLERELQAVALLGVDRQVDVGCGGEVEQRNQAWHQFAHHAVALRVFVARVQCRQLDRDAVALRGGGVAALRRLRRDRADRAVVGREVAQRIAFGARAFAQHVERKAQRRRLAALRCSLVERLVDVAAEHELPPEQLDRAHGGRHHRARAQPFEQARWFSDARQPAFGQHDRAGRQRGEQTMRRLAAALA